jgi:hypothetical protein
MDDTPVSFLGRTLPPGTRVRTVILLPAQAVDYRPEDWADTLVVVERGTLELECSRGVRARFGSGSVLTLVAVEPRRLLNSGSTPLVLKALTR